MILLMIAPPGLGKSYDILSAISYLIPDSPQPVRFTDLVDRHERGDEIIEELGQLSGGAEILESVVHIRGKVGYDAGGKVDPKNSLCLIAPVVDALRRRNYMPREFALSCKKCKRRKKCPYLEQFKQKDKSWIMTLEHLASERTLRGNTPSFIVADEGFLRHLFRNKVEVSLPDIDWLESSLRTVGLSDQVCLSFLDELRVATRRGRCSGAELRFRLSTPHADLGKLCRDILADSEVTAALDAIEEGAASTLPKHFLPDLLRILAEEHESESTNSRLSVEVRGEANTLVPDEEETSGLDTDRCQVVIREVRRPNIGSTPLLILDATGCPELYEYVLGQPVETRRINVRHDVEVLQLAAGTYGKSSLVRSDSLTRRSILKLVETIVVNSAEQQIGIIAFKHLLEEIEPMFAEREPRVVTGNFWGLRGTNKFKGCGTLIVIGTPMMNMGDFEAWAEALYWDGPALDRTSVERWERLGPDHDDPTQDVEAAVHRYLDPRLQALAYQFRDAELVQAVGRLRSLDRTAQKRLIMLGNLPLVGSDGAPLFHNIKVFRSIRAMRHWFRSGGKPGEPQNKTERIRAALDEAARAGKSPPTRSSLMARFDVSESLVKQVIRSWKLDHSSS